jgi:serine/threonine protein kinase
VPLPAGTRVGAYEIVALAGAGGMGEVYRARDTRLDRDVAVKVVGAELLSNPEAHRVLTESSEHRSHLRHR